MFLHLILFTVGAGGVHSPRQTPSGSSSGSEGAEGAMPPFPHSPVKISHKKDGRRRQPYRFHVSPPPPTRPLDPLLGRHPLDSHPPR